MAEVSIQLHVSCLWHQRVDTGATTSLAYLSKENGFLVCGLASAATDRADGDKRPGIALLCTKTGELRGGVDPPGIGDVVQLWCQGHNLACCQADGTLSFWPLESLYDSNATPSTTIRLGLLPKSREQSSAPSTLIKQVRCCVMAHDGSWFATGSLDAEDGTISMYSLPNLDVSRSQSSGAQMLSATRESTLIGHTAGLLTLGASCSRSGSDILFSGSYDATVRVWTQRQGNDCQDWQCLRVLKGHGGGPRCIALSSDSTRLYTGAADNTIRVWSTSAWVSLRLLHGRHEDTTWPTCMALTPFDNEGQLRDLIASGSTGPFGGSTIKLFDSVTGDCLATIAHLGYQERGAIRDLTFSTDGKILYSAASDGTVAAWSLERFEKVGIEGSSKVQTFRKGFF
jgi:WD40 repeat protein